MSLNRRTGGNETRSSARKTTASVVSGVTSAAGSTTTILGAFIVVLVWIATGPLARYSDTWQLVINTLSSVLTFVMVFIIQNSQNRDSRAIQAKLDDILRSLDRDTEELIGIEEEPEVEIKRLQRRRREADPSVPTGSLPRVERADR